MGLQRRVLPYCLGGNAEMQKWRTIRKKRCTRSSPSVSNAQTQFSPACEDVMAIERCWVGFCCVSARACSRFVAVWQTQDVWEVAWTPRDFTELMNAGPTQQLQRVSALQELQTGLEASLALLLCYGHEHRHHWLYWDDLIKCKVYALCLWGFRAKSQICFLWSAFVYFKLIIQNCLR